MFVVVMLLVSGFMLCFYKFNIIIGISVFKLSVVVICVGSVVGFVGVGGGFLIVLVFLVMVGVLMW